MRMTRAAIAQLRYRGIGPTFYRLSAKTILYKRSEVIEWMESRACTRTDDALATK
jgi:predicted DNA-binding transcriptional regulator AlpA